MAHPFVACGAVNSRSARADGNQQNIIDSAGFLARASNHPKRLPC